jgi:LysM repeat protein
MRSERWTLCAKTDTPLPTITATPTATYTLTATPTFTDTPSPSPTQCMPWYNWPVYIVVARDNLSKLAAATRTTYVVLMTANCLTDTVIYVGQHLYVPRLPATPTNTTPPNIPTMFEKSSVSCPYTSGVDFYGTAFDPEGISTIEVTYWTNDVQSQNTVQMTVQGKGYQGTGFLSSQPGPKKPVVYYFTAVDSSGSTTVSAENKDDLSRCYG